MMKLEKKWMSLMKKQNLILSSILIFFFFNIIGLFASEKKSIFGKAIVIDGDTLRIRDNKIRLSGIDAPEIKQLCKNENELWPCGEASKNFLEKIINSKILCNYIEIDRYKRILGNCFLNGIDLNKLMVKNGFAVAYTRYSKKYLPFEEYAKKNKLGIWIGEFMRPEEWRKKNK